MLEQQNPISASIMLPSLDRLLIKPRMKRPFLVAALAVLVFSVSGSAATPDETYVKNYQAIVQADSLIEKKQEAAALDHLYDASEGLTELQKKSPKWNPDIVKFRLNYVQDKIRSLQGKYPEVKEKRDAAKAAAKKPKRRQPKPVDAELDRMTQDVVNLRIQRSELEAQLREALAAKPSPVDPAEFKRAQETIGALSQKVADLQASLEQAQMTIGESVTVDEAKQMKKALSSANKAAADSQKALGSLEKKNIALAEEVKEKLAEKAVLADRAKNAEAKIKDLEKTLSKTVTADQLEAAEKQLDSARYNLERAEKDKASLKKELASLSKRVDSLTNDPKVAALRDENKALKKQLDAVSDAAKTIAGLEKAKAKLAEENAELESEVDALEAAEKSMKSQAKKFASVQDDLADSQKKTKSLEALNKTLSNKLNDLEDALEAAEKNLSKVVTKADLDAAKDALGKAEKAVGSLEKDNRSLSKTVASLEKKLESASTSRRVAALREANDELKARLDEAIAAKEKIEILLTDPTK